MSRSFTTEHRDPWDVGYKVYKHTNFTINPGLTVFTGCNGAGKSTLINIIKEDLRKNQILFTYFNNLHDGGSNALQSALSIGAMDMLAGLATSSEGEAIRINLSNVIQRILDFAKSEDPQDLFSKHERIGFSLRPREFNTDEIWMLFDASDSGLSIDIVIELKKCLHSIIDGFKSKGKECYVIIAANEYEMCDGESCFDVQSMSYKTYKTYNSYKRAILRSARYKADQIIKARNKANKTKDVT